MTRRELFYAEPHGIEYAATPRKRAYIETQKPTSNLNIFVPSQCDENSTKRNLARRQCCYVVKQRSASYTLLAHNRLRNR